MASWKDQFAKVAPRANYDPIKHGVRPAQYLPDPNDTDGFIVNPEWESINDPGMELTYQYPKLIKHPRGYLLLVRYVNEQYVWAKRIPDDLEYNSDGDLVAGYYGNVSRHGEQFGTVGAFVTINDAMEAAIELADSLPIKEPLP